MTVSSEELNIQLHISWSFLCAMISSLVTLRAFSSINSAQTAQILQYVYTALYESIWNIHGHCWHIYKWMKLLTHFTHLLPPFKMIIDSRADLKPIPSIVPNWASRWSYIFSAIQVHTTTHCRFYREQHWAPHLLKLPQFNRKKIMLSFRLLISKCILI